MNKISHFVDELNDIITNAVNAALTDREKKEGETLISRKAAAKRLGVAESTLWRWDKAGTLKVTVRRGRSCFYSIGIIRRFEKGEME